MPKDNKNMFDKVAPVKIAMVTGNQHLQNGRPTHNNILDKYNSLYKAESRNTSRRFPANGSTNGSSSVNAGEWNLSNSKTPGTNQVPSLYNTNGVIEMIDRSDKYWTVSSFMHRKQPWKP